MHHMHLTNWESRTCSIAISCSNLCPHQYNITIFSSISRTVLAVLYSAKELEYLYKQTSDREVAYLILFIAGLVVDEIHRVFPVFLAFRTPKD